MFLRLRRGPLHQKGKKRAKERDNVISMSLSSSLPLASYPELKSGLYHTKMLKKTSLNNPNNVAVTYCQQAPHLCTDNSEPGKQQ